MNAAQFVEDVKATFHKYFPNGYSHASKYCLGGGVHFNFGLIGDLNDVSSRIRENDVMKISFGIHDNIIFGSEIDIEGKLIVEFSSAVVKVLPKEKYYAMSNEKIAVRKINNTPEKIIAKLDQYFKEALAIVQREAGCNNIYSQDRIPVKYLKF
jgi:hypothetical protein